MTALSAILVGLGAGYFVRERRKAFKIMIGAFVVCLLFQSFVTPFLPVGNHNIDLRDPGYWLTQPVMLALGFGFVWAGSKIKMRRSRSLHTAEVPAPAMENRR
jgi:hypothetical protein